MKLGLCIQEVYEGERRSFESEQNASWLVNVIDLRDAVGKSALPVGKSFRLISVSDEGLYLTSVLTAAGRPLDYYAAWLFIPLEALANISGHQLANWTTELLCMLEKYDGNIEPFDTFAKKLTVKDGVKIPLLASAKSTDTNATYAMRCYKSNEELENLLSPGYIQQPMDSKYKGVVMLDEKDKVVGCQLDDLSKYLRKKLIPVSLDSGVLKTYHVSRVTETGEVSFVNGTYMHEGEITLAISHADCRFVPRQSSKNKPYEVKNDKVMVKCKIEDGKMLRLPEIDWVINVASDLFIVADQDGNPVKDYIIKYNNNPVRTPFSVLESAARALKLTFCANNHVSVDVVVDVLSPKKLLVELPYKTERHVYLLPGKDKNVIPVAIEERKGEFHSPIKGFVLSKKKKHNDPSYRYLVRMFDFKDKFYLKRLIYALILGFVLGLFAMWLVMRSPAEAPKPESDTIDVVSEDTAVADTIAVDSATVDTLKGKGSIPADGKTGNK